MDYEEFVRGCHLGVFPSYYEPWGYTPGMTPTCQLGPLTERYKILIFLLVLPLVIIALLKQHIAWWLET